MSNDPAKWKKLKNPRRYAAEVQAQKQAHQQSQLDQVAREREAIVAQQQEQGLELQRQQQAEVARQAELKAELERQQAAQQLYIAGARAAAQSVAQSLQILSGSSTNQAPTAAVAQRKRGLAGGARTASASLRIGSVSSGSGAGPNLPV